MASYNRVVLLGNCTRDIEIKYLQNGTAVCELGLAVNEKWKDKQGNWVEECVFVDVTLWKRTAEIANEYLRKGDPCLVEGKLKLDTWESDGQKRSKLKVVGERLQLLGGKKDGGGQRSGQSDNQSSRSQYSEPASDISSSEYDEPPGGDDVPF